MYEEAKYTYYRKKKIPGWWIDYLPNETNPYKKTDTLTIYTGCLAEYWHIHSSNKHPNPRGVEACNYVHDMIYNRFGAAFLSPEWQYSGGRQGQTTYNDKEHIVYKNAYIGEDKHIHIKDAYQYYEDVVSFVRQVLREISRNHYQSGNSYNASDFFPPNTDAAMEKYNNGHIDLIENNNCTPTWRYYPQNIFLDNKIKKLKLVYRENAGKGTWRMRW